MLVLAIDTALAACSAAVLDSERDLIVARESLPMERGQAELLIPLLSRVMDVAGVAFTALARIAVTVGPGSFTGLRVGIAAARGIALASGRPAVGVTTFSAFAAPHLADDDSQPVVAAIDARHQQVYLQVLGPGGKTLVSPRIASLTEAARAAPTGAVRVAGTAAALVASAWRRDMPPPAIIDARGAPDIEWVARLGAEAADTRTTPKPLYIRAPDARPQHGAQLPRR